MWVAGQTATQDGQGNNIANNFEAQVKQVFSQVDGVLKRAGGSLDNVVTMTVFIKESRYGDRFVEMRKDFFKDGNYPGSALITVTNFARPGIEIEIQAVGVIGDNCSSANPCRFGICPPDSLHRVKAKIAACSREYRLTTRTSMVPILKNFN